MFKIRVFRLYFAVYSDLHGCVFCSYAQFLGCGAGFRLAQQSADQRSSNDQQLHPGHWQWSAALALLANTSLSQAGERSEYSGDVSGPQTYPNEDSTYILKPFRKLWMFARSEIFQWMSCSCLSLYLWRVERKSRYGFVITFPIELKLYHRLKKS